MQNSLLAFLVIGVLAGWLAGRMMRGRGYGFFGNMLVGVLGAYVGGFLFSSVGLYPMGFLGSLLMAFAGAVVLLFIIGIFRKRR
ncbi:MAG: GlsB/YeaQ/YmgE family stress response membrane protein [Thermovirgaceae bacterium]